MLMSSSDPKKAATVIIGSMLHKRSMEGKGAEPTPIDHGMHNAHKHSSSEPSSDDSLEASASALLDAIDSKDPKAVADAFKEMFSACELADYGDKEDETSEA